MIKYIFLTMLLSVHFFNATAQQKLSSKELKVETDITEDLIRAIALSNGLVDVKVCAVDDVWSGLKLVVPVRERGQ